MDVVEGILVQYSDTTPLNNLEALISSTGNDNVHLDFTYFLFRREPELFIHLLQSRSIKNNNNDDDDDYNAGDDEDDDDDHDHHDDYSNKRINHNMKYDAKINDDGTNENNGIDDDMLAEIPRKNEKIERENEMIPNK